MYSSIEGEADTSDYLVLNDTKLLLYEETFDIKTLTDNAFSFYIKGIDSTDLENYEKLVIDLRR